MKPELKARVLAYNQMIRQQGEKAKDLELLMAALMALPPGQQIKVLTADILAVLTKYGYNKEVV